MKLLILLISIIMLQLPGRVSMAAVPEITAEKAVLIEAVSGRVLFEKKAEERAYPASLTKMLTCLLALEKGSLDDTLTISNEAAATEDAFMGFAPGDQISMRDALMGLMLVSDNSAAVAIAESVGGSRAEFAEMMNERAKEMGAFQSHFVTPNGLPHPDHYSTARDIAIIAAGCWQNNTYRDIVGRMDQQVRWIYPSNKAINLKNTNKLLWSFDGANGMKTGWTQQAGGCLAASASRNGINLIAIVLDSSTVETRFTDAQLLLDYGFSIVKRSKGVDKARTEKRILVTGGEDFSVTAHPAEDIFFPVLSGESSADYTLNYSVPLTVKAPVSKGQSVGSIAIMYKGQELRRVSILADNTVHDGLHPVSLFLGLLDKIADMIRIALGR